MKQHPIGTVVAYSDGESATFRIKDIVMYGQDPRYYGPDCLGGTVGRYHSQLMPRLSPAQISCWNKHHPAEPLPVAPKQAPIGKRDIEAEYREWLKATHPGEIPPIQVRVMRTAFFSGALVGSDMAWEDVVHQVGEYVDRLNAEAQEKN